MDLNLRVRVRVRVSVSTLDRRAFLALYAEARRYAMGSRAGTRLPLPEVVSEASDVDTRFTFDGTVSGGDESRAVSIWRWTDPEGRARGVVLMVPHGRLRGLGAG